MIDHNVIYVSHPLYNQFIKWGGLDGSDDSYYMINTSLYAAESYIFNRLGVNLMAKEYQERLPLGSTETRFKYLPSKLLSIFKSNKLLLPTVDYFNSSENRFTTYNGGYFISDNDAEFSSVQSGVSLRYLSGFVYKDEVDYDDGINSSPTDTTAPSKPVVRNVGDTRVESPTLTSAAVYSVIVKGEVNGKVIINETDSTLVIGANGEVTVPLTIDKDTNVFRISIMDASNNVSDVTKVFVVKATSDSKAVLTVLGYELVTKSQAKCTVYLSEAGNIEVDGIVLGAFPKGVNKLTLPTNTVDNKVIYNRLNLVVGTKKSTTSIVSYLYNSTLDDLLVEEINKDRLDVPYMPMELMVAFFRLAQHLYHGTLYKDENIGRYSAGTSKNVSFTSHRIPKDILNILHSYVAY